MPNILLTAEVMIGKSSSEKSISGFSKSVTYGTFCYVWDIL